MEFKLKKAIPIDGEEKEVLEYDLEELTGENVALAVKDLAQHNLIPTITEFDQNYHAAIFAQAAGISYADVKRMALKDFNRACNVVRDFFQNDSEDN